MDLATDMYLVGAVAQRYLLASRSDSMDVVQAQQSSETAARHLSETAHIHQAPENRSRYWHLGTEPSTLMAKGSITRITFQCCEYGSTEKFWSSVQMPLDETKETPVTSSK